MDPFEHLTKPTDPFSIKCIEMHKIQIVRFIELNKYFWIFFFFSFVDRTSYIMIVFFTNLMHKFFILIYLLYSSTCFEHYYAHLQEDNCISTASGIVLWKQLSDKLFPE